MSTFVVGNHVLASLSVQNFTASDVAVEQGMEILKYETETMDMLDSKAEFDGETYSSGQFEVGQDDLVAIAAADDFVELNHYGDNPPDTSLVDWWDDDADSSTKYNWRYRRCFTVDHTAVGALGLTEYPILVKFDTASEVAAGQMNVNGDDIRFVDEDDNVLPYYIAKDMNTADTIIWIQMDNITAAATEEICMYHGDVSGVAPALSDEDSVFTYSAAVPLYYTLWEQATGNNTNIGSYVDGNDVTYGGFVQTINEYEVFNNEPVAGQAVAFEATGPLSIAFNNNSTDAPAPISFAGTSFVYDAVRSTDRFNIVAPYGDANVTIQEASGGVFVDACGVLSNFTVTAGTAFNVTCDITNNRAYKVTSDEPILIGHTTTNNRDTFLMYPSDKTFQEDTGKYELWGVGSNSMRLASDGTCNNVDIFRSNGASTTVNLNAANNFRTTVGGGSSEGRSDSFHVVADCPIGAASVADSDGTEQATFLPETEFADIYLITQGIQYVAGNARSQNVTCNMFDAAGLVTDTDISTDGDGVDEPSEIYFPSDNNGADTIRYNSGFRMECAENVYAYYERGGSEETNFNSYIQARKSAEVEPVIEDPDDVDEQGLYYESGFNAGNIGGLQPILWLDASDINGDGTSPADGVSIDEWYDKSSQENHAFDVGGAGVPLKITELGRNAVEFTTDIIQTENTLFPNLPATDATYFVVSRTRLVTAGFTFVTVDGTGRFGTHIPWSDNNWYSDFDCCTDGRIATNWGGNTTDYFIWNGRHSSTNGKELRRDGASIAVSGINTNGSNSAAPLTIGGNSANAVHQQINISELIVFDKELTQDEIQNVERYLADKWSITTPAAAPDNKAYLEWIIDRSADTYGDDTFWDKIQWEEVTSDRTSENGTDGVVIEVASSDDTPSCAGATYDETVIYENVLSSSLDATPPFSDETTSEKFIKIVDTMSDAPCLRVRAYIQTGDEAYSPRLNNIAVKYRVPTLLEDQLNTPSISIPGNDGSIYGDDRVRIVKVRTINTGLTNSMCQLGYNGTSNAGAFSNADFEFVDVGDDNIDEEVLQFDFPAFPAAPPEVLSGNDILCDDTEDIALYFDHQRTGAASESIELIINQDIQNFNGPFKSRDFTLNVAGV